MGKALMVSSKPQGGLQSGSFVNFFGFAAQDSVEASAQASCTEAAAFTGLGFRVLSGGSGTNTQKLRDAGADGQNTAAVAGTGTAEDTTNTDSLSAGDLFALGYTDTGTNSVIAWTKINVAMASGHGNFHGVAEYTGVVFDVASATRFIPLSGNLVTDGNATEDNVEWKTYAYDSWAALQVRVTANARTNDSTFKNRINGADGTGVITFGAGITGLIVDTGIGDAIAAGNTVNASITLDTGAQDLTVTLVAATLKSSTSKSEIWCGSHTGLSRAASATASYAPIGGYIPDFTSIGSDASARIKPGFAAVVSNLRCYLSANTYSVNGTLKLMQNGTAVITTDITLLGGAGWYENTTDTITIDDNDELSFEIDEGTTGSITIHSIGITFAPTTTYNSGALGMSGTGTVSIIGAATASSAELISAAATLTLAGASTASSEISVASTATLTLINASLSVATSDLSIQAAATLTPDGAATAASDVSVIATAFLSPVGASVFSSEESIISVSALSPVTAAIGSSEISLSAAAALNVVGAATASSDVDIDASSTLTIDSTMIHNTAVSIASSSVLEFDALDAPGAEEEVTGTRGAGSGWWKDRKKKKADAEAERLLLKMDDEDIALIIIAMQHAEQYWNNDTLH